jgi:glyceraldehyde-3-phosphate dehydrogenase (NADP+) (phosphorylating)
MPSKTNMLACGALASGAVWSSRSFVTPGAVRAPQHAADTATATGFVEQAVAYEAPASSNSQASGWSAAASVGAALGIMGAASLARGRTSTKAEAAPDMSSRQVAIPVGKAGFVGATADSITVITRCPKTGRAQEQQVRAATAMAAGSSTKAAINGFGRIGRNVLRCWLKREEKPFDIVAINVGSMGAKTAAHLLKYDTVLGTLQADVSFTDDDITVDGKVFKVVSGRDPAAMPWKDMDVEVIIESTGAFNSLDGGAKHLEAGAKKVVLTAPGKNCPTYVVGVNEGDYDAENDTVVSNASCTTNGMASVCKVLDESFGVEYGMMTTTHSYTGDQMILDGRHRDLRRARAGACNIVPTSTGAAKAVAAVLPKYKGKLNGIALRVPTPNVSIVDLVVKVSKKCSSEDVNKAIKAAADGPMKGIINFEEQPLVSSDFMQTDYSNSVDAALTMVMGEDLVKVVMWYDNEWGYSQRVIDLTAIVAAKLPVAA